MYEYISRKVLYAFQYGVHQWIGSSLGEGFYVQYILNKSINRVHRYLIIHKNTAEHRNSFGAVVFQCNLVHNIECLEFELQFRRAIFCILVFLLFTFYYLLAVSHGFACVSVKQKKMLKDKMCFSFFIPVNPV